MPPYYKSHVKTPFEYRYVISTTTTWPILLSLELTRGNNLIRRVELYTWWVVEYVRLENLCLSADCLDGDGRADGSEANVGPDDLAAEPLATGR